MNDHKGSILVTGANGGLGSAIVSQIVSTPLGKEYHGVYIVRNPKTATSLRDALRKGAPHKHNVAAMDLASLSSVREAAANINKRVKEGTLPRIRALILNAAYQDSSELKMSDDGFEMSFQVNHLSHFLLTLLLLESMDKEHGRIVILGSASHDLADPNSAVGTVAGAYNGLSELFTNTERLARGKWSTPSHDPSPMAGYRRYGATKLCQLMFMNELQSRLCRDPSLSNIVVAGVDPGGMSTGLLRNGTWINRIVVAKVVIPAIAALATHVQPNGLLRTTSKSAADVLSAAFDREAVRPHSQALYLNGSEPKAAGPEARDEKKREMLWKDSVGYVGLQEGDTVLPEWR